MLEASTKVKPIKTVINTVKVNSLTLMDQSTTDPSKTAKKMDMVNIPPKMASYIREIGDPIRNMEMANLFNQTETSFKQLGKMIRRMATPQSQLKMVKLLRLNTTMIS